MWKTVRLELALVVLVTLGGALQGLSHRYKPSRWATTRHRNRKVDGTQARIFAKGCLEEKWYDQWIDNYQLSSDAHYNQRYFICSQYFEKGGPIFFYAGNEADVELYVNATGLMWQNAQAFKALIVFAEHRYYGQSQPFGPDSWRVEPRYLTTEQALLDFARLLYGIRSKVPGAHDSPVIAFGGSYGGMLAAWLRLKYPHLVTGAIAASAPIGAFPGSETFVPSRFWEVVTRDASAPGGAPPQCAGNIRAAFRALFSLGADAVGRAQLSGLLRLCEPLDSVEDVKAAGFWLQGAFDAYAMGNFPYASSYISGDPAHPLPAWPMRRACDSMVRYEHPTMPQLLEGIRDAVGMLYNSSGTAACFALDTSGPAAGNTGPWDYQFCTELDGQEQPYYPTNGKTDMFWDQGPFDLAAINAHCLAAWNTTPRIHHSFVQYGGVEAAASASNMVFSNGLLDPWSVFGVLSNISGNPHVIALTIPNGAHHVDLMFSHPDDPPDVITARQVEVAHMGAWIQQHAARRGRKHAPNSSSSSSSGGSSSS